MVADHQHVLRHADSQRVERHHHAERDRIVGADHGFRLYERPVEQPHGAIETALHGTFAELVPVFAGGKLRKCAYAWNVANSSADSKDSLLPAMYAADAMPCSARCLTIGPSRRFVDAYHGHARRGLPSADLHDRQRVRVLVQRSKDDDIALTRARAAKQLGYSVNYAASALRSDVTKPSVWSFRAPPEPFAARNCSTDQADHRRADRSNCCGHRSHAGSAGGTHRIAGQPPYGRADRGARSRRFSLRRNAEQYANTRRRTNADADRAARVRVVGIDENAAMEATTSCRRASRPPHMAGNRLSFESAELFVIIPRICALRACHA